ncbi:MAG: adenylate/guanylate cyclase domain-containing protein [Thermodesulfobacteriota bacterium]
MDCPQCHHENRAGAKFCRACGAKLDLSCPSCGTVNEPGAAFCDHCGTALATHNRGRQKAKRNKAAQNPRHPAPHTRHPISYTPRHLADRILAEREAIAARGAPDGERKSVTVLFADLTGSTDLIADLDPEDARAIIDPTLQLMMDAVHRYEGYVAQSLGDGIFALFGAPIAHEDHPQRALYAALLMQDENRKRAECLRREKGVNLQLRVGVNTGEVVLRSIRKDDLHTDYVPVGHSTHLASRLESLATPGSILVSEQTYKLTEGYFEFKPLGEAQVKGFPAPVKIYEVAGVGPLRTKLQLSVRRGLARFVGRQRELDALQAALAQVKAGRGQIVGVMGEPGVGKSRLFHEFKLLHQTGCLILETFSVSHGKAYPYLPLIDLLKHYFQLATHDDERRRREKITGRVLTLERSLEETLPYLFHLLGIAEPTSPLRQMDPQIRRKRTLEAIKRVLVRESLNQPLLLVFVDLHWLDNETQAFLSLLGEGIASTKILLLVNYRPEYRHEWGSRTYYTQLRLDPLGRAEAEEMLTALLTEKVEAIQDSLLQDLKRFILDKTEGNPFFMEEIVQALVEQGVVTRKGGAGWKPVPTTHLHLPPTVQAVLTSRIDRLPPEEKELLQTLAVIGKEFSLGLLKQVVDQPEDALQRRLAHLREAEFIYEHPAFPEPEYVFKHALTQEVAYTSLLQERRKILHERAARAIETSFPSRLEDHYSELAAHYSRSGNTQKAVDYLQRAGQQATQRSAHAEAIAHLTAALELLASLPDTPQRAQRELTLQIALGAPLRATRGYAASEIGATFTRARELCQQQGDTPQLFPVLWGLWYFYLVRAEYQTARELGQQCLGLAQRVQDTVLLVEAHFALGTTLLLLGEFLSAREHLEQGVILYDSRQHRSIAFLHGQDPKVTSLCIGGLALWHLGYPDQALQRSREALALAHELSHPFSVVYALRFAALLHQYRREAPVVQERAEAGIALATEHGFARELAWATIVQGWALAEQGHGEEGIAQMRQGLAAYRATGSQLFWPHFLVLLAEAYGKTGQTEEGLNALAEALAAAEKNGERINEPELCQLKGELTLQKEGRDWRVGSGPSSPIPSLRPQVSSGVAQAAERDFLKALEIARQQAKSLELRASVSLARLWQQQGKRQEAHNLLAEIYGWFTEGFDTADLQEAKALLDELAEDV